MDINSTRVGCFLPCRRGSERIPNKNIKKFSNYDKGLIEIKLKQLLGSKTIGKIYLSTDDQRVIRYAKSLSRDEIVICERTPELCTSKTSTDDLVNHVIDIVKEEHIIWTHVTAPFVTSDLYDRIVRKYFAMIDCGYDSLLTGTPIQSYLWTSNGPINYDRTVEKWPRTQTLSEVYDINSACFISSFQNYIKHEDRIGIKPFIYHLNKVTGLDIDWPEDYELAVFMYESRLGLI